MAQALVLRQKSLHSSWAPDSNELLAGSAPLELKAGGFQAGSRRPLPATPACMARGCQLTQLNIQLGPCFCLPEGEGDSPESAQSQAGWGF